MIIVITILSIFGTSSVLTTHVSHPYNKQLLIHAMYTWPFILIYDTTSIRTFVGHLSLWLCSVVCWKTRLGLLHAVNDEYVDSMYLFSSGITRQTLSSSRQRTQICRPSTLILWSIPSLINRLQRYSAEPFPWSNLRNSLILWKSSEIAPWFIHLPAFCAFSLNDLTAKKPLIHSESTVWQCITWAVCIYG